MPDHPLTLLTAAGRSLASASVFVGDPDEIEGDSFARVHRCQLDDGALVVAETLPWPVGEVWLSANGTLYCSCLDGFVAVQSDGAWTREPVGTPDGPPGNLVGFSGASPQHDVVVVTSDTALYVRTHGTWQRHDFPEDVEMCFGLHGVSPQAVYICTSDEGLHRFTGDGFEFVDMPFEEEPCGVLVTAPDDLLVTADELHLRIGGEWSTPPNPGGAPTVAVTRHAGDAFIGTTDGIVRRRGEVFETVRGGLCNMLASVGDALLAGQRFEGSELHIFESAGWRALDLPRNNAAR